MRYLALLALALGAALAHADDQMPDRQPADVAGEGGDHFLRLDGTNSPMLGGYFLKTGIPVSGGKPAVGFAFDQDGDGIYTTGVDSPFYYVTTGGGGNGSYVWAVGGGTAVVLDRTSLSVPPKLNNFGAFTINSGTSLSLTIGDALRATIESSGLTLPQASQLRVRTSSCPGSPAYSFSGDTNTGMCWGGVSNTIAFAAAGVTTAIVDTAGVELEVGQIRNLAGTAAAPSYTFAGREDDGFYSPAANVAALSLNGLSAWACTTTDCQYATSVTPAAGSLYTLGTPARPFSDAAVDQVHLTDLADPAVTDPGCATVSDVGRIHAFIVGDGTGASDFGSACICASKGSSTFAWEGISSSAVCP